MNRFRSTIQFLGCLAMMVPVSQPVHAWGADGHRAVGLLASQQMYPETLQQLRAIFDTDDDEALADACNWPDRYRATEAGAWSGPQHYINVPRDAVNYVTDRDCPGGACSAEALKRYALELGDRQAPRQHKWRAWAWICHLAGDIHQPMHSGYAHDRGGNDFPVVFKGREMNLHAFWDHALVELNYADWRQLAADLGPLLQEMENQSWHDEKADEWVRESHRLLRRFGYPKSPEITREFAAASWLLARQQLVLAALRLAALVNTVLTEDP